MDLKVEIITIGDELLTGRTVNANAAEIGEALLAVGATPRWVTVVGDQESEIAEAVRRGVRRADAVVVTGGLGPTDDDRTREGVARAVHRKLVFHRELLEGMRARWSARGLDMPPLNERQAYLPSGAVALPNAVGSAPGFRMAVRSKDVFVVPGVPAEMRAMLETSVLPDLRSRSGGWVRRYRTLHTAGWPESRIAEVLTSRLGVPESRTLAYLPYWGGVDLRVGASGPPEEVNRKLGRLSGRIRRILGPVVFGTDGETLSGVIGRMLREKKATVAVAESCTGGLISSLLTDVAGSSRYFERAVVAYSNRSKVTLLGVRPSTLRAKGAVSVEAAAEMAAGVRRLAGTKYGLSATGIAGPAGATRGKPVGLVYVGLASGRRAVAYEFRFPGGRERVKILTATTALNLLRLHLLSGTLDHLGS